MPGHGILGHAANRRTSFVNMVTIQAVFPHCDAPSRRCPQRSADRFSPARAGAGPVAAACHP
jgi:hypothetical protein